MAKKRVHELAKELRMESKEIIQKASQMGINIKSHMSTLEPEEIEQITGKLRGGRGGAGQRSGDRPPAEKRNDKSFKGPKRKNQERNDKKGARDKGPGLVDKVPSRPPDRRFSDKPNQAKGGGKPYNKQQRVPSPKQGEDQGQQDRFKGGKPTGGKYGRPQQGGKFNKPPRGKGKPVDKIKAAEKAKPDVAKAQEKVRAQERAKQVEKQAYREAAKQNKKKQFDKREFNDGKALPKPGRRKSKPKDTRKDKYASRERRTISIKESATVKELAEKMSVSAAEIIKKLMSLGVMATINQEIDADTAVIVGEEFNVEVNVEFQEDEEQILLREPEDDEADLEPRPCVVTVMGHVDHGKTSLLDAIRETKVTASEAGGITQHIGAYQVERKGQKITFVDTPGHEAFTAMRARGAQVTDVAILVVAADDGVMPQTVEAINHAKAAKVPIIVAINKMDKVNAQPDRVKQNLTEYDMVPEDWGGDTICVPVSAINREGLDELLEMILLVSEMQELKANPNREARGVVIEAELDKGRGPVATVLVQNGTLNVGDILVAGTAFGKVRAMLDHTGSRVEKAGPATPVQVLGFSEVPEAGEVFLALADERKARQIADKRQARKREEELKATTSKVSLDDLFNQIQEGRVKELAIIIKADVQGSVEALKASLEKLSTDEVKVNIIHGGVGAVNETDVMLASASNAIVIGFNVRPDANARKAADTEKVDIRLYRVIYEAIEDVKAAMSGLLDPEYKEVILGRAEVRQTFKVSKVGTIAGCYVTEGKMVRDAGVRLIRDGVVVYEGKLDSLKRFKDDAKEVVQNYECGLTLERFNDIQEGDIIEAFTMEEVQRELA
jgi:translation initiation factor IF-2